MDLLVEFVLYEKNGKKNHESLICYKTLSNITGIIKVKIRAMYASFVEKSKKSGAVLAELSFTVHYRKIKFY